MTEYLIASRAAIIFWTSLAVVPAEILLQRPNWSAAAWSDRAPCLVLR
jgi:hypothetical protein